MTSLLSLARFTLAGLRVLVAMTVLLGIVYPLAVLGVGRVATPWQADGSLVTATGAHTTDPQRAVGSLELGQVFTGARWFHARPSVSGDDPLASGGSNLGPNSPVLLREVAHRRLVVARSEGVPVGRVPADAVTASASGLDPHISPAYAALQVGRVARANGLTGAEVRQAVLACTVGRTWGVLGEPRVNVLELNLRIAALRR